MTFIDAHRSFQSMYTSLMDNISVTLPPNNPMNETDCYLKKLKTVLAAVIKVKLSINIEWNFSALLQYQLIMSYSLYSKMQLMAVTMTT